MKGIHRVQRWLSNEDELPTALELLAAMGVLIAATAVALGLVYLYFKKKKRKKKSRERDHSD